MGWRWVAKWFAELGCLEGHQMGLSSADFLGWHLDFMTFLN